MTRADRAGAALAAGVIELRRELDRRAVRLVAHERGDPRGERAALGRSAEAGQRHALWWALSALSRPGPAMLSILATLLISLLA